MKSHSVPDLIAAFMTAPNSLYSGLMVFVTMLNSAIASGLGIMTGVFSGKSFQSCPFINKSR